MRAFPLLVRRAVVAGAVALGAELAVAVLWPVPDQTEHDASGTVAFGEGPPLRVVALGDSTLTAPGVDGPDQIWVRKVASRLAQATGRTVELLSLGAGGATSAEVVRNQLADAVDADADLALISVGANDVIRGIRPRALAYNLDIIVGELSRSGALVITSGVGDLGAIPRLQPPLRQIATRLGRQADRAHDLVARRHNALKAEQWTWSAHEFRTRGEVWSADRFHPGPAGHEIWAEVCWEALEPLLPRLTTPRPDHDRATIPTCHGSAISHERC